MKPLFTFLLLAVLAAAQSDAGLERRVQELERKMRELDPAFAVPAAATLEQRIATLEQKMTELTRQPATPAAPPPAPESEETRLPVAGYMEFHFNKDRGLPGQLDFHRFVLLFAHSFSDRIKFWSELEVEHAIVEGREQKGELKIEQAYLDFLLKPYFNLRGGLLLAPVGLINERHEPPSFNGVERPLVDTFLIPSTWFEPGFGFTGDLGRGFRYRAYLMSSLDATFFSAEEGLRGGRQQGFRASFRNPAKTARLEYYGVRRLTLGASIYTGHAGFNLRNINPRVRILSVDSRYGWRRLDLRGQFTQAGITRARELNLTLEQLQGFAPNVARQMRGYYAEPAVHVLPRRIRHDLALFTRYERFNTQHRMPEGFQPLGQFDRSAWVLGATYKPNADVVFKFDYIFNRNKSTVVRAVDSVNVGLGWWF